MPIYTITNRENNETKTVNCSYSQLKEMLESNPNLKQELSSPLIGDPVTLGVTKKDQGFQKVLQSIKKANRGSTIKV
jgi:hypothetical protein